MKRYESLHHTKWDCKYHMIWIPKYRRKVLYGQLRKELGAILRELALQKKSEVVEGRLKVDHVHMLVSIPPKYSASGRVCEREERNLGGKSRGAQSKFPGSEFLGAGVLCFNHWAGRGVNSGVYPGPRRG